MEHEKEEEGKEIFLFFCFFFGNSVREKLLLRLKIVSQGWSKETRAVPDKINTFRSAVKSQQHPKRDVISKINFIPLSHDFSRPFLSDFDCYNKFRSSRIDCISFYL